MKPRWISRMISAPLGVMLFLAGPAWAQPDWVKQERQSTLRRAEPIRVGGRQRGRSIVDWQQGYIQVTTRATADPKMCVNIFQCAVSPIGPRGRWPMSSLPGLSRA